MTDKTNPVHYTKFGIKPIDVMEDWKLPSHLAFALKYIARRGGKDDESETDDIKKAIWYLVRYISKESTAKDFLEFAGAWKGDDVQECIDKVKEMRL